MAIRKRNYGYQEAQLWHLSEAAKRDIMGKSKEKVGKRDFFKLSLQKLSCISAQAKQHLGRS